MSAMLSPSTVNKHPITAVRLPQCGMPLASSQFTKAFSVTARKSARNTSNSSGHSMQAAYPISRAAKTLRNV